MPSTGCRERMAAVDYQAAVADATAGQDAAVASFTERRPGFRWRCGSRSIRRRADAPRVALGRSTDRGREVTARVEVELQALRERVLGGLDATDIAAAQRVFAAVKAALAQ